MILKVKEWPCYVLAIIGAARGSQATTSATMQVTLSVAPRRNASSTE